MVGSGGVGGRCRRNRREGERGGFSGSVRCRRNGGKRNRAWQRRKERRRPRCRGVRAGFQRFQPGIEPLQHLLEVRLLTAQRVEEFAIFGNHALGYYVRSCALHKCLPVFLAQQQF